MGYTNARSALSGPVVVSVVGRIPIDASSGASLDVARLQAAANRLAAGYRSSSDSFLLGFGITVPNIPLRVDGVMSPSTWESARAMIAFDLSQLPQADQQDAVAIIDSIASMQGQAARAAEILRFIADVRSFPAATAEPYLINGTIVDDISDQLNKHGLPSSPLAIGLGVFGVFGLFYLISRRR